MNSILLGFAALSAATGISQPATSSYRAVGTEPFWSVSIDGRRMVYEDAEGRRIDVAVPRAAPMRLGHRYVTRRLRVTVFRGRSCSDGMSDRTYRDTVRVMADGRNLDGCGGPVQPPATLAGTQWEIVGINGRSAPGGERYRLRFERDRLSGGAGCNSFGGSYRVSSDGFQATRIIATQMLCRDRMRDERDVLGLLGGRLRLFYPDGSTLIMRGEGGEIRLRRVI